MMDTPLKVIIVGCGLGGLACAIACRKEGFDVLALERAPEILPIGAGIQVPPNAMRVMRHLGLAEKLLKGGAIEKDAINLRNFSDGEVLAMRPGGRRMIEDFGDSWCTIHRADYFNVLSDEAVSIGVKIRLGCDVQEVSFDDNPQVKLSSGETIHADVIVGADGLWSTIRDQLLGRPSPPIETGDLAYRATIAAQELKDLKDPGLDELMQKDESSAWLGPAKHCVLYPVRDKTVYNLVLLRPDDLPTGIKTATGDLQEMRDTFKEWDPRLTKIISRVNSVLKWKLCHQEELETWTKGHVALLGDSCHPTLPYQAQGAAMAVEDGAVLGVLLGALSKSTHTQSERKSLIPSILQLYESLRKSRTTLNVQGAVQNRLMFHLSDPEEMEARNKALKAVNWKDPCVWNWGDMKYMKNLLGFDAVRDAREAFDWWSTPVSVRFPPRL